MHPDEAGNRGWAVSPPREEGGKGSKVAGLELWAENAGKQNQIVKNEKKQCSASLASVCKGSYGDIEGERESKGYEGGAKNNAPTALLRQSQRHPHRK